MASVVAVPIHLRRRKEVECRPPFGVNSAIMTYSGWSVAFVVASSSLAPISRRAIAELEGRGGSCAVNDGNCRR